MNDLELGTRVIVAGELGTIVATKWVRDHEDKRCWRYGISFDNKPSAWVDPMWVEVA